jgi:plasmid rolling circle replication initiator protein Rep
MNILEIWQEAQLKPDKPEGWGVELINEINGKYIEDIQNGRLKFIILPLKVGNILDGEEKEKEFREMETELNLTEYEIIDIRKLIFVYIREKEVV